MFPSRQGQQSLGRLSDLRVTGSQYGTAIPQVYGAFRVPGNIIWAKLDAKGNALIETSKKKGSKLLGTQTRVYSYSASYAPLICRGPVSIRRIWSTDRTVFDLYADPPSPYTLRIYRGDENQLQDPLIAAAQGGTNQVPAYRGSCYVVFEALPLASFNNAIPNLSFELDFTYPELIYSHPSLQSYWRFESETGKLTDIGPKAFTLTETSPATQQVTGCFQALNGTSGGGRGLFNTTPGLQVVNITGNVPEFQGPLFTVEGWFKFQQTLGGSSTIVDWFDAFNAEHSFRLTIQRSGANTQFQYTKNITGGGSTLLHNVFQTRDSLWHHVMVTYSSAGNTVMYIDGAVVSTVATPGSMTIATTTGTQVELRGGEYGLDEVALYNDSLTAADAAAHFAKGVSG